MFIAGGVEGVLGERMRTEVGVERRRLLKGMGRWKKEKKKEKKRKNVALRLGR